MPTELDTYLKEVHDIKAFMVEHQAKGIVPLKEEIDRMAKSLTSVQEAMRVIQRDQLGRMTDDGRLRVSQGRFLGFFILLQFKLVPQQLWLLSTSYPLCLWLFLQHFFWVKVLPG